jgi:hypothetical protein
MRLGAGNFLLLLSGILGPTAAHSKTLTITAHLIPKVVEAANERSDCFAVRCGPIFSRQFQNRKLTTQWSVSGETSTYAIGSTYLSFDLGVDAVVSGSAIHPIQIDFKLITRIQPKASRAGLVWNHVSSHRQAGQIPNSTELDRRRFITTGSSDIVAFEVWRPQGFTAGAGYGLMDQTANPVPRLLHIPGILYNQVAKTLLRAEPGRFFKGILPKRSPSPFPPALC